MTSKSTCFQCGEIVTDYVFSINNSLLSFRNAHSMKKKEMKKSEGGLIMQRCDNLSTTK